MNDLTSGQACFCVSGVAVFSLTKLKIFDLNQVHVMWFRVIVCLFFTFVVFLICFCNAAQARPVAEYLLLSSFRSSLTKCGDCETCGTDGRNCSSQELHTPSQFPLLIFLPSFLPPSFSLAVSQFNLSLSPWIKNILFLQTGRWECPCDASAATPALKICQRLPIFSSTIFIGKAGRSKLRQGSPAQVSAR